MKTLDKNWITENRIDFEYKKYILLAYLQEVNSQFEKQKLYPALSDLIFHYQNLIKIRDNKNNLFESFPERMVQTNMEQFKIIYEKACAYFTGRHIASASLRRISDAEKRRRKTDLGI